MKVVNSLLALVVVFVGLVSPVFADADESTDSLFCTAFGWVVRPLGFCQTTVRVEVVTSDAEVLDVVVRPPVVTSPVSDELPAATSSYPVVNETLESQQLVVSYAGVTEARLNERITQVLMYINSLPHQAAVPLSVKGSAGGADRDYVIKSVDKIYDTVGNRFDSVLSDGDFSSPQLTDAILGGTTYTTGWLGVGTSSPSDVLAVAGALYLGATAPTSVANRLYNVNGDLYWNGQALSSSTASTWQGNGTDVFRSTGSVGIGTTTPSATLTVAGTILAGTTTARIVDLGGEVCNVEAYGAVGDNSTINDAAIAAAIAACGDGGTVFFPMGQYRISSPIILDRPVTLRGAYSPRWSYSSTPRSSIRADFGSFSGVAMIHVRDKAISGEVNNNNGGRLEYLSLDGGSASTDVDGVYFEGLVRDWKLTDVDISQVTGNGFESAVGAGSGNPRGFTIRGLSIYSADGHGFRATALNDSYIEDLLSVGNALRGIYLSSMGETKINNSRAVFNGLTGLYIDGSSANGGLMFTDFSTDRNDRHGVRISLTGTTTVTFNGLLTRRDGANLSGGTETPYAGVAIIGTTSEKVAPVFINGLSQIIGVDDSGNPPLAPLTGVRVTNASYVKVDGQLWGVNEAYRDDGGNDHFIIEEDSIIKVGNDGVTESIAPLFNDKWIASSTVGGLRYDGRISIGSSTDSRLLNIVAPSGAGARFRDTTNNVIFDMRAEDYQGFFGTFSNHQLRFQTNNTSRLTIDTNGYVGIGTTSPDQALDVIGTVQSSVLLGGATTLATDANGNIIRNPSDRRLKQNIESLDGALEKLLQLRGVRYEWKDHERFGDQEEIGFIAQEVDEVVPEVVRKGGDYWSLNTANLLAVVVEAVKEIWQTVTGNQQKIAELEVRVSSLEAAINASNDSDSEADSASIGASSNTDTQHAEEESVTATTSVERVLDDVFESASSSVSVAEETAQEVGAGAVEMLGEEDSFDAKADTYEQMEETVPSATIEPEPPVETAEIEASADN